MTIADTASFSTPRVCRAPLAHLARWTFREQERRYVCALCWPEMPVVPTAAPSLPTPADLLAAVQRAESRAALTDWGPQHGYPRLSLRQGVVLMAGHAAWSAFVHSASAQELAAALVASARWEGDAP